MNILHITRRFYPGFGGVETYIRDISEELIKQGINCNVLTIDYNIYNKEKKYKGYENLNRIGIFRIPAFGSYKKPIPLKIPLGVFKWADIIHIHDVRFLFETACFLKLFFKYKIVFSTHGFILHTADLRQIKYFMIPLYYKPMLKLFSDKIICDSIQDYKYFFNIGIKNNVLIENGLILKKFLNVSKKIMPGKLLYFGRVDINKRLDLLFHALAKLQSKDWFLDIIGDGSKDYILELKNTTETLNISQKVRWHGFVDEDELLKNLEAAHLCFFPSRYEGFGFTLVEAMASKNVCIANNIKAFKDIIGASNAAYIVDFNDFLECSKLISMLLQDNFDKLEDIGNKAREITKRFDWNERILEIIELYENVLSIKNKGL